MHCRSKEHVSKFNSKSEKLTTKKFLTISKFILKAYKKPFKRLVEEGTFITSHRGELLNSKSEWHQAKVVRTRTEVVQGGAEVVQQRAGGGSQGEGRGRTLGGRVGARTQGQ